MFKVKEEFPLHFAIFKSFAGDLAVESNAENTFSLSGKLSDDNGKTDPGFLACLTRINHNRARCNPESKRVLTAYRSKHGKAEKPDSDSGASQASGSDADVEMAEPA